MRGERALLDQQTLDGAGRSNGMKEEDARTCLRKIVRTAAWVLYGLVGLFALALIVRGYSGWSLGSTVTFWPGPENPAIRVVERLGGRCYRPSHLRDGGFAQRAWVHEVVGNPVVEVDLQNLHWSHVADPILTELHPLHELRRLLLSNTAVTDAGLKNLTPFRHLRELTLSHTSVTDAGLKELTSLGELEELDLSSTGMTDAGLKYLATLQRLKSLKLNWTRVTDVGLKELTMLRQLKRLDLWQTRVTDAGVRRLTDLKELEQLCLLGTDVTDACLSDLAKLRRLRVLYLSEDKVTRQGAHELKHAIPEICIWLNTSQVE